MNHYLLATPPDRPASILRFHSEQDAEDYRDLNPEHTRHCDQPADFTGFRHFQTTGPGRVICGGVRGLTDEEKHGLAAPGEIALLKH